jgi:glycosyltransferase involved in cell wall biosynthesis
MKPDRIAIIIPVRREEGNIIRTLEAIRRNVAGPYRVYVVDDAIDPTDRTADVVARYQKGNNYVRLIGKKPGDKPGFWQALKRGVLSSDEPNVLFMMADLCDNPRDIDIMRSKLGNGVNVVCGSRYIKGGSKEGGPKIQGLFSFLVNRTMKSLLNLPTYDVTNAFKLYRREAIMPHLESMKSGGLEASMELYLRTFFSGIKSVDIPTHWQGRVVGESKFRLIRQAPVYARIYFWAFKTKYLKD